MAAATYFFCMGESAWLFISCLTRPCPLPWADWRLWQRALGTAAGLPLGGAGGVHAPFPPFDTWFEHARLPVGGAGAAHALFVQWLLPQPRHCNASALHAHVKALNI